MLDGCCAACAAAADTAADADGDVYTVYCFCTGALDFCSVK